MALEFDPIRLPEDADALRQEVRDFIRAETDAGTIGPAGTDDWNTFNKEFSRKMGAKGWIAMTWPKAYGGHERSHFERYVVTEEMLAAKAPTGAHFVADRQSGPVLLKYADESIKQDILPRIAAGECSFCIGMSEPDSGSDLFAAKAKAEKTANGWLLNGRKVWTTNAHLSDYMIGLFRTSPKTPDNHRHGLTQFLIDMKTPGISTRPIVNLEGRHEFNEVLFEDAEIPEINLLGEPDMAWKQATSELAFERSGPERFLETYFVLAELVELLGPDPDTRGAEGMGRMIAQLHALRQMSISVNGMLVAGKEPVIEAAVVKDVGTTWQQAMIPQARDLAAFVEAAPDGNRVRFDELLDHATMIAPKVSIQGGTREVMRGIIARGLGLR